MSVILKDKKIGDTIFIEDKEYVITEEIEFSCKGCSFFEGKDECSIGGSDKVGCTDIKGILIKRFQKPVAEKWNKEKDVRSHNIGNSDYSKHKIQVWDIWKCYKLNNWDADIIKRVLRKKKGEPRRMTYEKIIHICQERIRQIDEKKARKEANRIYAKENQPIG